MPLLFLMQNHIMTILFKIYIFKINFTKYITECKVSEYIMIFWPFLSFIYTYIWIIQTNFNSLKSRKSLDFPIYSLKSRKKVWIFQSLLQKLVGKSRPFSGFEGIDWIIQTIFWIWGNWKWSGLSIHWVWIWGSGLYIYI